ncbi:Fibrocystin-L-like 2 [Homarus americanus]|uniref:Fibrocystin-L-like 2 n=1 Tax=Homarus americanus TaxID=6706 RepID=A0A8J5TJE5_HOMAM|nr:Fibrocystin-L-like 2 [Homarus americanus]
MGASRVYVIKVYVDGSETTGYATVEYASWRGPVIDRVIPAWSLPGAMVEYQGNLHTTKYLMIDAEDPTSSDPSKGAVITKVYMGGVDCEMVNATTGMLYVPLTSTRKLHCLVTSTYIGPMNTSVYVTDRGASSSTKWGMGVDSQDRLFQHHTYAAVESVSPDTSSSGGGALLTITGVGFDSNLGATEVRVGGAVCELQEITGEIITCLSPPQHLTGPGSGERGLIFELWEGAYFSNLAHLPYWDNLTSTHPNYTSSVTLETRFDINLQAPSTGRIRGYIHAPHDGVYSLGVQLGKASIIYVATNGNPDNKTNVAHWQHLYLQKDTPAYMEIIFNSEESTFFRLMFNDFNAKFTSSQSYMASNERQQVRFKAGVRWETQRLTLEGEPGNAKLFLQGVTSSLLNVSDPNEVKQALLNMTEQLCEVLGDGPKFGLQAGYEVWETKPPGDNGNSFNEIEPFCGRVVQETRRNSPQLYYNNDVSTMVDANTYKYVCLALRGNVESMMSVRFYWKDKWNRNRDDTIWFNHNITSTPVTWTYKCLSLHDVVANSWMKDQHISGQRLLVKHVWAPKPSTSLDTVYVDEFALVDLDITVVQRRPSALKSLGILVTEVEAAPVEGVNNSYDVSFITSNCAGDFPLLGVFSGSVNTSWLTELAITDSASFEVGVGQVTVNRQVVATHSVGGTWDLLIQGKTIAGISSTVDEQELSTKIETGLGGGRVAVSSSGTCYKRSYQLEWLDDPGMKDLVEVEDTGLVFDGETLEVEIKRTGEGKIWHDTLHVDFLTTWREEPQVVVTVNKYTAACLGDCSLTYDDSLTPTMSTVSGSVDGTGVYTITVTGSGFTSTVTSDYRVTLGGNECTVTTVTPTQVTCTVKLHAGEHDVTLTMQPIGAALTSSRAATTYTVPLTVSAITPTTGGTGGGYTVVISGTGFPSSSTSSWDGVVMLGGAECVPVGDADGVSITCLVSAAEASVVDVVVTVGSLSATLSGSFTYDASLSASLTSASPSVLSVTGGQELVISGSSFGSDTNGAQGFASGDVSVTYTLVITGSSVLKGSVNGGTIVVLKGQGFGTNCSLLEVDLGDSAKCEVTDCSDTEVTCAVLLTPVNHVVTNMGTDPSYGVGFAWSPRLVEAREGDSMTWQWNKKDEFSILRHNIFQSVSSTSFTYDGSGFHSGSPTPAGSMTVYFPHEGTYYYAGDPVSDKLVMSGQINVVKPENHIYKVTLTLGGVAAEFNPSGDGVVVTVNGCVPILLEPLNGCTSTAPSPPDAEHLGNSLTNIVNFKSEGQVTVVPVVTSFEPTEGSVAGGTTITITGTGLKGYNGVASVRLGAVECQVTSISATTITCTTIPTAASTVPLSVYVSGVEAVSDVSDSTFSFTEAATPTVSGVSVSGDSITITGLKFGTDDAKVTVTLNPVAGRRRRSMEEEVEEEEEEEEEDVPREEDVLIDDEVGVYDEDAEETRSSYRPKVQSHLFDKMDANSAFWGHFTKTSGRTFTETKKLGAWRVGGTNRATLDSPDDHLARVTRVKRQADPLPSYDCSPTSVTDTTIICDAPGIPAGNYDITVAIEGLGDASVDSAASQVTVAPEVTSLTPAEGSVHGGALLTIAGTGFNPGEVSVTLDGAVCHLETETTTSLTCRTSAHTAGTVSVTITSGTASVSPPPTFTYDDTKTPGLTSITPSTGVTPGTTLTLEGANLQPSGTTPEVLVDGTSCTVITASLTAVTCTTPDLVGGSHGVIVRDSTYGDSNEVTVSYVFSATSVTPSTGSFGGSEVTVTGEGFDPSGGSRVTFCGELCDPVNFNSSTTLVCVAPAIVDDGSGTKTCDIVVTNPDGSTNTLTNSFTYDASLTPVVTAISPVRGGTAGGTLLTITGTGFAASGNKVTIGGSECVVNTETTSQITCTTEAHQGPGYFPVLVDVPSNGLSTSTGNDGTFFYIDRWSSIYTWGGGPVPSEGQLVVIEEGQTILMDQSTEVLKMLLIKGEGYIS